jgi:hypothetical protein
MSVSCADKLPVAPNDTITTAMTRKTGFMDFSSNSLDFKFQGMNPASITG